MIAEIELLNFSAGATLKCARYASKITSQTGCNTIVINNECIKGSTHYLLAIIKTSTFRAKAPRLELVERVWEKIVCFYTSEYMKQLVTKYKPIRWV